MANIILPQASLLLGIVASLIILYISIKGFEGHFKDKTIFLTFILGIVLGACAAVARIYTEALVVIYVILLAIFDQLIKTIVLNTRRLQAKRETTIYGLSLGLGFGSIFTLFLLIVAQSSIQNNDLFTFVLIGIGSLGFILFHAASGAYIGYGIYSKKLTKYIVTIIIIQLPFNVISDMTRVFFSTNYFIYLQAALVIYGAIIFWYVTKKIMPRILPKSQRRKRIKNPERKVI